MSKEARLAEMNERFPLLFCSFGFRHCFVIRHSPAAPKHLGEGGSFVIFP
jgi:hypothetical protein